MALRELRDYLLLKGFLIILRSGPLIGIRELLQLLSDRQDKSSGGTV